MRIVLLCVVAVVLVAAAAWARQDEARTASSTTSGQAPSDALAIIVNRSNPVDNLSSAELRQYFLVERTRWPNGRRVSLVMLATGQPEREAVLRLIYRMRERDFHEHFLHARFTGVVLEEPRVRDTSSRVLNFVFLQMDALAYVRASETAGAPVKVVRIDGLLPGEPGYKLTLETALTTN
ncbi:MAG TPA: hypothetical protein VGV59_02535 [Pyrinomonadaceae bacterium]|nr:hypothetical protein [Pyrinomonadaceae bacterium]